MSEADEYAPQHVKGRPKPQTYKQDKWQRFPENMSFIGKFTPSNLGHERAKKKLLFKVTAVGIFLRGLMKYK